MEGIGFWNDGAGTISDRFVKCQDSDGSPREDDGAKMLTSGIISRSLRRVLKKYNRACRVEDEPRFHRKCQSGGWRSMTLDRSIPRDSWPTEATDPLRDLEAGSRRAKRNGGKSEKGEADGRKEDRSERDEQSGQERRRRKREKGN